MKAARLGTERMDLENRTYTLLERQDIAPQVARYVVRAPDIAKARKAGQFVIARVAEGAERIPLTIADADTSKGTITLVVQQVGTSTSRMSKLRVGEPFADIAGPLGTPTRVEKIGNVVCVGGGIGIAPIHPIAQAMRAAGNRVVGVLAARNRDLLFFREEMRRACDEIRIFTDDGSEGKKGLATDAIKELKEDLGAIDEVVAIGPVPMMKFVSLLTKELGIPTQVSLNAVMIDGTGMCGGCRVTVGGQTRFVCVDGPEFDGHAVDFDELSSRLSFYRDEERRSHKCFMEGKR